MNVDALAQEIRRLDGDHTMGAGTLAEVLMPFIEAELMRLASGPWVSVKDSYPPETGDYLVAYHWPGHGGIWYVGIMNFLHTAYETKFMAWHDKKIAPYIEFWATIALPAPPA